MKFKLLTYNIHKGFASGNRRFVLKKIKESIHTVHADLVCIQEAVGHHSHYASTVQDWPKTPQFDYLAERLWPHVSYGKNKTHGHGHHGNAILSKFPISFSENEDISLNQIERRGLLHSTVEIHSSKPPIHVFCVHLGLFEKDRRLQIGKISKRIQSFLPPDEPVIIAGDFNDWRQNASDHFMAELGIKEAFFEKKGRHASSFPSWFPALSLDRIYFRNLKCIHAEVMRGGIWSQLSDHLPLLGEFEW